MELLYCTTYLHFHLLPTAYCLLLPTYYGTTVRLQYCTVVALAVGRDEGKGPGCENEPSLAGLIPSVFSRSLFLRPVPPYGISLIYDRARTHIPAVPRLKTLQ